MAVLPVKLFLSYCSKDKLFADQLYKALRKTERFQVLYDRDALQLGHSLVFAISDGLNERLRLRYPVAEFCIHGQ